VFHGFSAGNTSSAARMRSASGVSNITGRVTAGTFGSGRPLECFAVDESSFAAPLRVDKPTRLTISKTSKGIRLMNCSLTDLSQMLLSQASTTTRHAFTLIFTSSMVQ
jgi:hypothetical protein